MAELDLVSLLFGASIKFRERAEERLDEVIKKGEDWAKDWKEKLNASADEKGESGGDEGDDRVRSELKKVRDGMKQFLREVGVSTADDLKDLESRIDKLSAKLEKKHR